MEDYVLRTNDLTKIYTNAEVVGHVNMTIKRGGIYGLIGKNEAGKTTLMRMIAGLVLPTTGSIELFEQDTPMGIKEGRKRIGVLIEKPAFFPHMTAGENMELVRLQKGIPGKACIKEKLEWVGLGDTGKKKVKDFSMGMKQKLGIAMALLGDPEFLILDEPTNGLDPMGIAQMRELYKRLNQEKGVTLLISSHILEELHQLASCYGFIHEGRLIQEITQIELEERCKKALEIRVDEVDKVTWILENILDTLSYKILPQGVIRVYDYVDEPGRVVQAIMEEHIRIRQINNVGDNLEDYFINLIGGEEEC